MKTILFIVLVMVWAVILIASFIMYLQRRLEKYGLSKMTPLEKIIYMTEKYGKHWQERWEEEYERSN